MTSVVAVAGAVASCVPTKSEKLERPKADSARGSRRGFPDRVRGSPAASACEPDTRFPRRAALAAHRDEPSRARTAIRDCFAFCRGRCRMDGAVLARRTEQHRTRQGDARVLRGWCAAVKGDSETACANLTPLLGSTTSGLRAAVRTDLANILANGHADKASHLIKANNIRDVAVLDLAVREYVEVGTNIEAAALNREAIASDDYATSATKCERLTKSIVLSGDRMTLELLLEVEALAMKPKLADPTASSVASQIEVLARPRQLSRVLRGRRTQVTMINLSMPITAGHMAITSATGSTSSTRLSRRTHCRAHARSRSAASRCGQRGLGMRSVDEGLGELANAGAPRGARCARASETRHDHRELQVAARSAETSNCRQL